MRVLTESLHELWMLCPDFDDLLLTGDTTEPTGVSYSINVLDDNMDWGEAAPIDVQVQRWMTDGAAASTQGHEDREITFDVQLQALTSRDLGAAEAALSLRADKPCLLKWISPEGAPDAPPTIFEIWTWHLSPNFDGLGERQLRRTYTVTMTAKPNSRSETLTVAAAVPTSASPTITTIDACTSTTNWASNRSTPAVVSGAIQTIDAIATRNTYTAVTLTRTASTSVSGTPYLLLDLSTSGTTFLGLTAKVDTFTLTKAAQIGTVSYYALPASMTTFTTLAITANFKVSGSVVKLTVADVSRSAAIGSIGSAKQITRSLAVGGSVPTSGSIQVASPGSTALGTVLVHSFADNGGGYMPGLRQYRTAGSSVTPDATAVSANREAMISGTLSTGSVVIYTIPANALPPASYAVIARVKSASATTITATVTPVTGAQIATQSLITSRITWDSTQAGKWIWAVLGQTSYPYLFTPPESAVSSSLRFKLAPITSTPTVDLDEVYLLNVTPGQGEVSLVDCGTATKLWLDAPDADPSDNLPHFYVGTQADRSDAVTATGVMSMGDHDFDPRGSTLFTVTDGVDNAVVTASFYKRWHTHAGD